MRITFKPFFFIVVLTLALGGTPLSVPAATVVVEHGGPTVSGSTYGSIRACMDDLPNWLDGNDDTVLLSTAGVHFTTEELDLGVYNPSFPALGDATETLTIKSQGPGPAIVALQAFSPKVRMFNVETSGTYIFENLTCMGAANTDGLLFDYRTCFRIEMDDAGEECFVTIRNCVVTRNDGSDNPVLDFSQPMPSDRSGTFMRGIYSGDDRYRGRITVTVEDSVFAYLSNDGESGIFGVTGDRGGIELTRAVELTSPANPFHPEATREITFKNCLFANSADHTFRIAGASGETTITLQDCLITNQEDYAVLLDQGTEVSWQGGNLNFLHTIIEGASAVLTNRSPFNGSVNFDEATLIATGVDAVLLDNMNAGEGTFSFTDVIAPNVASLLRFTPDPSANSGVAPGSLTASSLATNAAANGNQAATVQTTMNNAVVTTEDPQFQSTSAGTFLNNIRSWTSANNPLYDVLNTNYAGIGTTSTDMRGGAEYAGGAPPLIPTSEVRNWAVYQ